MARAFARRALLAENPIERIIAKLVETVLQTTLRSFGEAMLNDGRLENHKLLKGVGPSSYDLAT